MKKLFRNFAFCFVFFVVAIGVTTCKGPVALGDTIDINPPKNEITYPPKNAVIRSTFVIAGKCDDDTAVSSVTVSITNTDTKLECGSFQAVLSEDKKSWSVKVENEQTNDPNRTYAGRPYQDGKYSVSAYATDNTGKRSDITSSPFIIDNTPPILLLTASSSYGNSLNPDKFGRTVSLTGTYAEDTDNKIAKMTIRFFKKADGSKIGDDIVFTNVDHMSENNKYVIAKYSKNPTTPEEVKLFENYKAIFGETEINNYTANGTAQDLPVYMTILLEDGARVYDDPSDLTGKEEGNQTTQYYINTDGFTDNFTKDGAQYAMSIFEIKDFLNGKSKKHEGQEAAIATALNAAKSTAYNAEVNSLTGTDTDKASTMLINPKANPTFTVSGYALDKGSVGTTGFNSDGFPYCTEGAPLSITISSGPDNVPVKYVGDKVTIYAVPAESDGNYSTPLPADWLTSENPPTALPAGWVKIANISGESNKTAYTMTAKPEAPATSYGLSTNTLYRFVIWGRDINGMAIEDGTGGPYVCVVKATGNVPVITSVKAEVNMSPVENVTGKYVNKSMVGKTLKVSAQVSDGVSLGSTDADVENNVKIKAKLNGSVVPDGTVTVTPSADKKSATVKWELTIPASTKDGKWTLTVSAKNKDGASGISESVELTIDTVDPTWKTDSTAGKAPYIDPTQPDNWYSQNSMNVKAKAEDVNGSGIETLKYKLSTSSAWSTVGNDDFSFSCGNAFNGTLTVEAFDKAENKIEVAIPVKVDMAAPDTYALSKVDGQTGVTTKLIGNSTTMVSFEFTASDATGGSGLKTAEIVKIGNNTLTPAITANETATGSGTFTASIPQAELAEGAVMVRLTDNAGNTQDFALFTLLKDVNPPTLSFIDPDDSQPTEVNKKVRIRGTASDDKELASVKIVKDDGSELVAGSVSNSSVPSATTAEFIGAQAFNWHFDLDTSMYPDNAELKLKAIATDKAGNELVKTLTLKVNQNADRPQIVVTSLSAFSTNSTPAYLTKSTLSGYVQDDDGAIKEFYISEDGSNWGSKINLNGQSWEYKFAANTDGDKTIYFKVIDKAEGVFISSATTGELTQPRVYATSIPEAGSSVQPVGTEIRFKLDTFPPQIDHVKFARAGESTYNEFAENQKFKGESITLQVKVSDASGIKEVSAQFDGGTKQAMTRNATDNTLFELSVNLNNLNHGARKLKITAIDNAGSSSENEKPIIVDKKAPTVTKSYPGDADVVAGTVRINGTIADDAEATSGVKSESTKWMIRKTSEGVPTKETAGWKDMDVSTVGSWAFDCDLESMFGNATNASQYGALSGLYYKIPMYILVEDNVGNAEVRKIEIVYNPDATKPVMTVLSPRAEEVLGGTIQIFGSGRVFVGSPTDITKVYIQFSTNKTGFSAETGFANGTTINGFDWKNANGAGMGKEVTESGASWNYTANAATEKLNPTTSNRWEVYFSVRGYNGKPGVNKYGAWTEPIKITIDKEAPTIANLKVGASEATAENYTPNMWVGAGAYLYADLTDDSGIKAVSVSGDLETGTVMDLAALKAKGWVAEQTSGSITNYKLKLKLNLDSLKQTAKDKKEFSITVMITEKKDSNPLQGIRVLNFRFDTEKPIGVFGEKKESGYAANFTATNVVDAKIANTLETSFNNKRILADNFVLKPTGVSGSTVTFTVEQPTGATFTPGGHNYVVYEVPTYVKEASWNVRGFANDDGSGVKEVKAWVEVAGVKSNQAPNEAKATRTDSVNRITSELGNQVAWNTLLDLSNLKDGKGKLHYEVTDQSGNKYEGAYDIVVRRRPVQVSAVKLITQIGGEMVATDTSTDDDAAKVKTTTTITDELNQKVDVVSSNFAFKSKTASKITFTCTGGEGTKWYRVMKGSTEVQALTQLTGNEIVLDETMLTTITNGNHKITLEVWDEAHGFNKGVDSSNSKVDITTLFEAIDETDPTVVILPFHWNSETDNSRYGNSRENGHIEIKDSGNSQVSGKVTLRGFAYDNIELTKITATLPNSTTLTVTATRQTDGTWASDKTMADGAKLTVKKLGADYLGYYVSWQLDWDTEKATVEAVAKEIKVVATDGASKNSAETNGSNMPTEMTVTRASEEEAENAIFANVKPGQFVMFKKGETQYLTRVTKVKDNKATLKNSVPVEAVDAYMYGYKANKTKAAVNIVPYITGVTTALSVLGGNEPDLYARTALGHYPVRDEEIIKLSGFNLTGAACTVGGVSSGTLSGSSSPWTLTLASTAKSGKLAATVSSIEAINNTNDNDKPYNKGVKTGSNDKLDDNVYLDVWQFNSRAAQPGRGIITEPVMRINPANGMIGFAFANGPDSFSMSNGSNNSYVLWHKNYDDFGSVDFIYDSAGNAHGVTVGRDTNANSQEAGKFTYVTSMWGVPGIGPDNNYSGSNALRMEAIGQVNDMTNATGGNIIDKTRIQHPSLAAATQDASGIRLYLAYYDGLNDQIRFKYGTLANGQATKVNFGLFADSAWERKIKTYDQSKVTFIAGEYMEGTSVKNTGNNTGTYLSLGVVSGTDADSDVAVFVWFDETSRMLKYTYKEGPQNTNNASPSGNGNGNWKKPVNVFGQQNIGEYCKIAVDKEGGIHIAAYDADLANLRYAYLSKYDATDFKTATVDSYGITGSYISLDVVYENGNPVPYIGYYSASAGRSKVAYLVDKTTGVAGGVQGTDDKGYFTGKWEVSIVPTASRVQQDNINVGVWKNAGVIKDSKANIGTTTVPNWKIGVSSSNTNDGKVYGNGTSNPVLAYAIKEKMNGYIETAQKK